ncbi:hypothetical protein [Desulfobacula phenolica]|uniref:Uncharacterized protein n=1 Tax=Desulfobacula phenolica TaxID=90732 RepID=A0A1H2K800_9BACT|nr:hypothetical protein [Desulfobacula phenolica]SDU64834.1 hypothetical protein SAMN04487931_1235 [Desulfobacula phenolica]
MKDLVLQSPAKLYFADKALGKMLFETQNLHDSLKKVYLEKKEQKIKAWVAFNDSIQPLQIALNRVQIKNNTPKPAPADLKINFGDDSNEVRLLSAKRLHRDIVKRLSYKGSFKNNKLMDKASTAFKEHDIASLFEVWQRIQDLPVENDVSQKKTFSEVVVEKHRLLCYFQLSIDILEKKILKLEKDPILSAYIKGNDFFENTIRLAKEKIQLKINRLNEQGDADDE